MDHLALALDKLEIKFTLNETPFHVRNLPFWLTKKEIGINISEVLEKVSEIKVFERLENQPAHAQHRGSSKIHIDTRFLLTSDCYEDILEDCKNGGDRVFFFL